MSEPAAIPPMPADYMACLYLLGQKGVVATKWPEGWWMSGGRDKGRPLKKNLVERMLRDGLVENRHGLLFRTKEAHCQMWENRWRISEFLKRHEEKWPTH